MKKLRLSLAALAACTGSCLGDDDEFEPHQVVVRLREGRSFAAFVARYPAEIIGRIDEIPARNVHQLRLDPDVDEEGFADIASEDPDVIWAEVNFIGQDPGPGTQSFFLASSLPALTAQPARQILRLPEAHQITRGGGVVIAVLDTGLDVAHPYIDSRIAVGGYNFIDMNSNVADVGDGIDSDNDQLFDEMVGHGTFISGVALMVAPEARILPIRVMDSDGLTNAFRVARGVDHAIRNGAKVINLSLSTPSDPLMLELAMTWATQAGVVAVASTGNEASSSPQQPSMTPSVVAVAATDDQDVLAAFSNHGTHVDVCAPGVGIVGPTPGDRYGRANGTSFASPMTAGAAALIMSDQPALPAGEVIRALKRGARNINQYNPSYVGLIGAGRVDAREPLVAACSADCDTSTGVGVLDIFDFLCFQNRFAASDPYACECDTSTGPADCDILDFLCFQNRFAAGCP